MNKMKIKLLRGGMIALLLLFMASSAFAAGVTAIAGSDAHNGTPPNGRTGDNYVMDSTGAARLPVGRYVQLIRSVNATIDPPNYTTPGSYGAPTGDDVVVNTGTIGNAAGFAAGEVSLGGSVPNTQYVYLRAWDTWNGNPATPPTGNYGDSVIAQVPALGFVYYYTPDSFATNRTPAPTIGFSPASFTFAGQVGGANPANQTLNISNIGSAGTTVNWTVSEGAVWLTLAPTSGDVAQGAAADTVALSVNIAGLTTAASPYTATITITDPAASNNPRTVPVTLNITDVPPATLTSATPNNGDRGATLPTVAIVGSGTHFTAASTVNFGAGITVGSVTFTDATHITANNVVISAVAATGARTVTVTTGGETATGSIFTVNSGVVAPPRTSFVIDDIEGTLVPPTNYYPMGPNAAANPTITRVTADKHEGANAMNSTYTAIADPANAWRGWGAVLATTQDASAVDTISFWMKGDGSTNVAKIQFKDQDGSNFGVADAQAVPLSDTTWREYRVLKANINTRIGTTGDATMDWSKVTQYQIIFSGTSASSGVLIDYVSASTGGINPQIISITPASAAVGDTITIAGANLDVAGTVQFITEGGVVTAVSSTATNTPISAWSAATVTMLVPSMGPGAKSVKIVRASDLLESNEVSFEVTATAAPADSATNAYPNPFNPLGGETTKIVFSPGSAARADIYIFDMTAKLVSKLSWPTVGATRPDGRVEVTWDGKNSYGEIVGDGVYLYRVVDGGVRKGKILVVNKK